MNRLILATGTLLQREVVRFLRQKHRIIGALGTPLVFWFLIGSGLGNSFRSPSLASLTSSNAYLQYFFPGTVALILLFTAIFSTISIIEDRKEGFLQAVMVSPAPSTAIVAGKLLGAAALALFQGFLFILLAPLLRIPLTFSGFLIVVTAMFLLSLGMSGLGFLMAWKMDSTQGFHAIMNLFLMPLWFLSGALFPAAGAPSWLKLVMSLNPLTYGVAALHQGFFPPVPFLKSSYPSVATCLIVSLVFAAAMFWLSVRAAAKTRSAS